MGPITPSRVGRMYAVTDAAADFAGSGVATFAAGAGAVRGTVGITIRRICPGFGGSAWLTPIHPQIPNNPTTVTRRFIVGPPTWLCLFEARATFVKTQTVASSTSAIGCTSCAGARFEMYVTYNPDVRNSPKRAGLARFQMHEDVGRQSTSGPAPSAGVRVRGIAAKERMAPGDSTLHVGVKLLLEVALREA